MLIFQNIFVIIVMTKLIKNIWLKSKKIGKIIWEECDILHIKSLKLHGYMRTGRLLIEKGDDTA